MKQQKVIIVGGGFGGLTVAKALKNAPVELLLIDKSNHHLFQPLLYQVATAALTPSDISAPLRAVLANQKNTTVYLAHITEINKEKKEVVAANGDVYPYDYLVIATGGTHSYFNHPEWEAFAPGLKTLSDAVTIREKILLSYERAERAESVEEATRLMRFIIVGAGPTGVEMAGAIAEIARQSLVRNFRHIRPEQTKVYLLEGATQVLPTYPKDLADKAEAALKKLGVEVMLNTFVTQVTPEGVWMQDKFLGSPNIIWAAGNAASRLLQSLDTPLDRMGRVIVNTDLTVPNYPDIFVIGDAAYALDQEEKPLPGIAPVAMQQGRYVAKIIKKNIPESDRKPFNYFDKGTMATIGKGKAVAMVGRWHISGFPAWLAWCFIHVAYLITFSNKLLVMFQWFYLYFANTRRIRLIIHSVSDLETPLHEQTKK